MQFRACKRQNVNDNLTEMWQILIHMQGQRKVKIFGCVSAKRPRVALALGQNPTLLNLGKSAPQILPGLHM